MAAAALAAGHRAEVSQERPPGTRQRRGNSISGVVFRAKSSRDSLESSVEADWALSLGSLAHKRTNPHSLVVAFRRGTKLAEGRQQCVAGQG